MRPLTTSANASKFNIQDLVRSINQSLSQNNNYDAFICGLTPAQWDIIASYMQPFSLANGQVLMEQGAVDRTLYFVENGTLSVHFEDPDGSMKLAMINPGSVVGEGAFFLAPAAQCDRRGNRRQLQALVSYPDSIHRTC